MNDVKAWPQVIFPLAEVDLPELAVMAAEAQIGAWTLSQLVSSWQADHLIIGLRWQQQWAGFAVLLPLPDEVELLEIVIAQSQQQQGWGRYLLTQCETWAIQQSKERMLLEVRVGNIPARGLYQSLGYREIGRRRGYYPVPEGGREDGLVLEKRLLPEEAP